MHIELIIQCSENAVTEMCFWYQRNPEGTVSHSDRGSGKPSQKRRRLICALKDV